MGWRDGFFRGRLVFSGLEEGQGQGAVGQRPGPGPRDPHGPRASEKRRKEQRGFFFG